MKCVRKKILVTNLSHKDFQQNSKKISIFLISFFFREIVKFGRSVREVCEKIKQTSLKVQKSRTKSVPWEALMAFPTFKP